MLSLYWTNASWHTDIDM